MARLPSRGHALCAVLALLRRRPKDRVETGRVAILRWEIHRRAPLCQVSDIGSITLQNPRPRFALFVDDGVRAAAEGCREFDAHGTGTASPELIERQFARLRAMSDVERLERARQLTLAVQQLDEIWLRLAADRPGREVVLKVYIRRGA